MHSQRELLRSACTETKITGTNMTLLSYSLFDHCSANSTDCIDDCTLRDSLSTSSIGINSTTGLPIIENTLIDVSGTTLGGSDALSESVEQESFCTDTTLTGLSNHDDINHTDDPHWGFILGEDGGINTFDDDCGATDWFEDSNTISDNCDH